LLPFCQVAGRWRSEWPTVLRPLLATRITGRQRAPGAQPPGPV